MAQIKSRKHNRSAQLMALAASLPLLAHAANPEDDVTQLPTITVKSEAESKYKADNLSSAKYTQPLSDTPQTISVIHHIPNVLSKEQVAEFRKVMETANWVGGKVTAGTLSASVKKNQQLSEQDPLTHQLSEIVMQAIWKHPTFQAAALPRQIIPPLFNRYDEHESFGFHVDNSIRLVRGTHQQLRTDLSCTLFLSEPEEYDGGDLVIEDTYGYHEVKLPAGDVVLYPSTSLHEVSSITRGTRFASFFWVQSLIRDDQKRHMLFNLDESIRQLRIDHGDAYPEVMKLTNIYHNLIRMWSEL